MSIEIIGAEVHTRVGDLEENVLHHVAAIGALELELLALEEDIVEAPDGGGEDGGNTLLTGEDLEGEVDGTLASITGSPGLSGHGVGGVSVGSERLAINPSLGNGIGNLLLVEAEHLGDDGGRGNLDQDNVVKTDLVVGVEESQAALDLVGLDHTLEDILDGEDLAAGEVAASLVGSVDPVGDSEDGTQVVGGMSPLSSQPAVVEVEPSDHSTNVEGSVDGVELEGSSRDLGAVGDDGAGDDGAEELGALLEPQTLKTAAEGVDEDPSSSVELERLSVRASFCNWADRNGCGVVLPRGSLIEARGSFFTSWRGRSLQGILTASSESMVLLAT